MANTASAKKRIRSSARKRERNRVYRSAARTYVKNTREAIDQGELAEAETWAGMAVQTLDKAASKGILHKHNASRRKGRLMKALSKAKQDAS